MRAYFEPASTVKTMMFKSSHCKSVFTDAGDFCFVAFMLKGDNREPSGNLTRKVVNTRNMWDT